MKKISTAEEKQAIALRTRPGKECIFSTRQTLVQENGGVKRALESRPLAASWTRENLEPHLRQPAWLRHGRREAFWGDSGPRLLRHRRSRSFSWKWTTSRRTFGVVELIQPVL